MPSISAAYALDAVRRTGRDTVDAFSLEELKRSFNAADAASKVRILKRSYRKLPYGLPFEIAEMAVTDAESAVRAWIASNGRDLDYSPWREDHTRDTSNPKLDLEDRLKNDPDEFVRACAFANSSIYGHLRTEDFIEMVRRSSQLERLGLMRNYSITPRLAAELYDLSKDFGITTNERAELLERLLDNRQFVEHTKYWEYEYTENKLIWELVMKWPAEHIQLVMRTVERIDARDDTKMEAYRNASTPLKLAILAGCSDSSNQKVVTEIGLSEKDDDCRELAHAVLRFIDWKKLQAIFKANDKVALFGLARNRNLPRWMLRQVYKHVGGISELHDEFGPDLILQNLARYISLDAEAWASGEKLPAEKRAWIIGSETLAGLFKLAVIGAAFLAITNFTESVIVAALILLYCKLDSGHSNLRVQLGSLSMAYRKNMLRLRRRLGITTDADYTNRKAGVSDDDDDAEKFLELEKSGQEIWLGTIVNSIFRGLIALGALGFLISAILSHL